MDNKYITAIVEEIWIVENPVAFEAGGDSVFFFILKTSEGYLDTKGLLRRSVINWLESLSDISECEFPVDCLNKGSIYLSCPEQYPHLKATKIENVKHYLLAYKLSS